MLMNRLRYRAVDEIFSNLEVSDDDYETSDDNDSDTDPLPVENILRQAIDPLAVSDTLGVNLYAEALRIVLTHYSH